MRDINRIDRVTEKLNQFWKQYPDLRFWQIINVIKVPREKVGSDPFFWEDDIWEQCFTINEQEETNN